MQAQQANQAMTAALDAALAATGELQSLLAEEQTRLASGDVDDLQTLLSRKLELLQELESQEHQRRSVLQSLGLDAETGMDPFLAQSDDSLLRERWQELLAQLRRLQAVNDANGEIIRRGMSQAEQTLSILTGRDGTQADAYDSRGGQSRGGPGRELSRA